MARYDGDAHDIHVRVAGGQDCIYLDLGDEAWHAVEVTSTGWRLISDPLVRFRRPRGMLPLAMPVAGGSIEELRPVRQRGVPGGFLLGRGMAPSGSATARPLSDSDHGRRAGRGEDHDRQGAPAAVRPE